MSLHLPAERTTDVPLPGKPIVVDLDRSLLRVDLLHEALVQLGIRSPLRLLSLAWEFRKSLASFKTAVATHIPVDPRNLPYDSQVISHLQGEVVSGSRIILATASPLGWAEPVAKHLGFFSDVLATDHENNLKRQKKLGAIRGLLGDAPFTYVGDSSDDIPIFEAAEGGRVLVGSAPRPLIRLSQLDGAFTHLSPVKPIARIQSAFRACRPVHWVKNLLIFLPAFTSWGSYDPSRLFASALAFLAFSLVASAVYLINDLADLSADRAHPDKRHRPISAGLLPVSNALALATILLLAGFGLAIATGPSVVAALSLYVFLNAAYTIRLKEMPLTDIALLCCFYLVRVMAGIAVLDLPLSIWFIAFLGCLFAELAHWKRYVEVISAPSSSKKRRSYTNQDANVLLAFGVGFSFTAALVLILYLRSDEISPIYHAPKLLALLAPILLLHNLGMWLEASRGNGASDPIMFILKSRKFWGSAGAALIVLTAARILTPL